MFLLFTWLSGVAGAATSVSQYGITWFFSEDRPVGQFANGDWWVVGPVTITNINPKTGDDGINFSHGSMINPIPGQTQGLYKNGDDNNPENSPKYDAAKNISLRLPVTVPAGSSVYSTMNNPDTWKGSTNAQGYFVLDADAERVWFKETAVLTVLPAAPPVGSFRPPYAGNDKTIKANWNSSSIDFSALRNLTIPVPSNAPSMAWLEDATRRPLLEMNFNYVNSQWKSSWTNKPGGYPRRTYGREVAGIAGGAGLMLNTNLSNSQKRQLAIYMIQWGIDTYGLLQNGMQYQANGGHQLGRLLPVYLAGRLLNDPQILAKANGASPFQEMLNHFSVTQEIINIPRSAYTPPRKPYTQDMLGMPEWCHSYPTSPDNSSAWNEPVYYSSPYRFTNGGPNCGTVATILLMGGRSVINHEPFFKYYIERYYPRERPTGNGSFNGNSNAVEYFTRDMWDVHINQGAAPIIPPPDPPPVPNPNTTLSIGDRVQVLGRAVVKSSANSTSPAGYQDLPNLGTVVEGPVGPDAQNLTWFRIDYDNGTDGWSSQTDLMKSQSPPASSFKVGDKIMVWRQTWVNATAAVTDPLGSQTANSTGIIVEGPVTNGIDNIVWFRIDYGSGPDGWSGADNLVKSSAPISPSGLSVVP